MHSLSLQLSSTGAIPGHHLSYYNSCSRRNNSVRFSGGRKYKVLACAFKGNNGNGGEGKEDKDKDSSPPPPPPPSSTSFLSRTQTYAMLNQQMEVAIKSEDYKEASRIRDSLKKFEEEEPVLKLRRMIREAVAQQRFEDAAKYRDGLKEIAPHCLLNCSSQATTLGIQVQVRSVYIEERSDVSSSKGGEYFFAYRVRISNNTDRPVQLLRRHWVITDANAKTQNLWGVGVIGEQPVILPKTCFEYSSACPLHTSNGRMEGDFEMKHADRINSSTFNVAIAPFALSTIPLPDDDDHHHA